MDVLVDLLPSVNKVKIASSKKDKRQRNKYSRQMTSSRGNHRSVNIAEHSEGLIALKQVLWDGPERRTSVDRRQLKNKRGRWLETRDRNDRRAAEFAISVKI